MATRARRVATATVAVVTVMIGFVAAWSADDRVEVTTEDDGSSDPTAPARPIGLSAPTDGMASRLLPVVVEPSTELVDGQVVSISGSGFTPEATLGAVLCTAGAGGGGGVAFCELAHYDNFSATSEGSFADDYVLRRFIQTPAEGMVDCGESTDRCLLAVGNISDYDESGGSFISYAGAPDPPPPQLGLSPSEGLVDGQVVLVTGTGLRASPDGSLRQCPTGTTTETACSPLAAQPYGPPVAGELSVTVQVRRFLVSDGASIDCALPPGCSLTTTEYARRLAVVPLGFAEPTEAVEVPPAPPPPPPTTAPPTTAPPTTAPTEAPTTVPPPLPPTTPPSSSPPPSSGVAGSLSELDLRLELDDTTLAPGASTQIYLSVENDTDHTIVDPACVLASYEFGLVPADQPDGPLFGRSVADCAAGGFPMLPGHRERHTAAVIEARAPEGGPLPPGDYLAVLRHRDGIPQVSAPLTVVVP